MSSDAIYFREQEFNRMDGFKDSAGQAHFPTTKMDGRMMDRVKLGKAGGYYPLMGGKRTSAAARRCNSTGGN